MSAHREASEVAAALAELRRRIDGVERTWNHDVEITAVTKAFPPTVIATAVDAGCRAIGENYAQELLSKRSAIESLTPERRPRIDFIGHLQSNKVRQIADLVDRWASVDRPSIVKEIARRAPGAEVLIQVNITGEEQKGGCAPEALPALLTVCGDSGLDVAGLLAIGPTGRPPEAAEPGFRLLRSLVDEHGLEVCSIGMTADLEVAVACGATNVRIGTALFGPRPAKPVHQPEARRG